MPETPPLQDEVLNQMRIGIEVPLGPDMPKPELTPVPVAGDDGSDKFLGFLPSGLLEAPEEWTNVTNFMINCLGFSVEEPENTSKFRDFVLKMYGKNWERRTLRYTTLIIEQLKALINGVCKLTTYQETQWAERFNSWPPSTL